MINKKGQIWKTITVVPVAVLLFLLIGLFIFLSFGAHKSLDPPVIRDSSFNLVEINDDVFYEFVEYDNKKILLIDAVIQSLKRESFSNLGPFGLRDFLKSDNLASFDGKRSCFIFLTEDPEFFRNERWLQNTDNMFFEIDNGKFTSIPELEAKKGDTSVDKLKSYNRADYRRIKKSSIVLDIKGSRREIDMYTYYGVCFHG